MLAVADFVYRQKDKTGREASAPPALTMGLDWIQFKIPICAGGMRDQPMYLMRQIRYALSVYHSIRAWQDAQSSLSSESFSNFCSANSELVKFMSDLWLAQEERDLQQESS